MTCLLRHKWEDIDINLNKQVQECERCGEVRVLHQTFQGVKKDVYESRKKLESVLPRGVYHG